MLSGEIAPKDNHYYYYYYRASYVSISNHCSAFAPAHSGVPQVQFSALYFSLCILSLCLPLSTHTIIHYSFADDS